ncbi:xyloglucan endotransglucosylase/hydrolase protein 2-like [Bidens hawaiensis]|uniref:xyloglucan endotransglucosylase/hydrolase protein 2-like n=1 Tax=Bidens hawaiensis TaxID=980011 RepID=UPI00404A60C0
MNFRSWTIHNLIVALFGTLLLLGNAKGDASFDENYDVTWGNDHVLSLNQGREIRLLLDKYSGSGFTSKSFFGSGFFKMKIKLPANDSGGLVTSFYLYLNESGVHDELDFEFLGNRPGKPIELQTNVFTNGVGGREQRYHLWFDPTMDFHYYSILWNHYQIMFFVDDIPIRVFKKTLGVGYPDNAMQVVVSLWDGSDWATDGGRVKVDFNNGPFEAYFQDFNINGCVSPKRNIQCLSQDYWWNLKRYWILNSKQQRAYEHVKKTYMIYDYCKNALPTNLECH